MWWHCRSTALIYLYSVSPAAGKMALGICQSFFNVCVPEADLCKVRSVSSVPLAHSVSFSFAACGMNVHHRCQTKVANLCGINQKLMAEALAMIESTQQVGKAFRLSSSSFNLARTTRVLLPFDLWSNMESVSEHLPCL